MRWAPAFCCSGVPVRRRLGLVLLAAGAALLAFVGTSYAGGAVARDRARAAWDAALARAELEATILALDPGRQAGIVYGAPVARLVIPGAGLDEVVVEGVGPAELLAGPGHLPGSVLPGEPGNAVIAAHRDRHFHPLARLRVGDVITTQTRQHTVNWVVISLRVVGARTPALFGTEEPTLTLTTCWPIRFLGSAPDRLVVTAVPVKESPGV